MTVDEIIQLHKWLGKHVEPNIGIYESLAAALAHNAQQSAQQPIRDQLAALEVAMMAMPIQELTSEQTQLLEENNVLKYFGVPGQLFIDAVIKESKYDAATASKEMSTASSLVRNTVNTFTNLISSLNSVGITEPAPFKIEAGIVTRVRFTGNASITDVVELKKWSTEWNDIARGLATAVGERPEDVHVIGAATGSIVFILGVPVAIVKLLVSLSKSASTISTNIINIQNGIEDLRHKKVLNAAIESAMREEIQRLKSQGGNDALDNLKYLIGGDIRPENEKLLKSAATKYLNFTEKGGEIDMLAPPQPAEEDYELVKSLDGIREDIEDVRKLKETLQLLIANNSVGV
jgi:hypothetical protein